MKSMTGKSLESARVTQGELASDRTYGFNGAFRFMGPEGVGLFVICSDGMGWEHVSVSTEHRCPTWEEMCWIKAQFWDEHETAVQYHPPKSEYVNNHPYCLHLWKPSNQRVPMPPTFMVGIKGKELVTQ